MPESSLDLASRLARMGLGDIDVVEPLTGGVSSDIHKVVAGTRVFVVKRALPQLKVAAEWRAPVERNAYEIAWLEVASEVEPDCVPHLLGVDAQSGLFAMDYLDPASHPVWKAQLRDGCVDLAFAAQVGSRIGAIHRATAGREDIARRFQSDHIFHPIRLEPYLEATAVRHPALRMRLYELSAATLDTKMALVHGDVSPKNILAGPKGPVFLDAECAWYGDPAFDLAFCLNHLLLKGLWNGAAAARFLDAFAALRDGYLDQVDWEPKAVLEARVAALLPALFLARIDGKSPVEYVTREEQRDLVRKVAVPMVDAPPERLSDIADAWSGALLRHGSGR